jgi:hypothetical protein
MRIHTLAVVLLLCACDDEDAPRDAGPEPVDAHEVESETLDASAADATGPEAANGSGPEADPRVDTLDLSLKAWQRLADENPGPYWYEEENCLVNAGDEQQSTFVQVDAQGARTVGGRSLTRAECRAQVNRFGALTASLPELHAQCASLIMRRPDTRFELDEQGIVRACWVGDSPNCKDNCGRGFYLRERGFGSAPDADAGAASDGG